MWRQWEGEDQPSAMKYCFKDGHLGKISSLWIRKRCDDFGGQNEHFGKHVLCGKSKKRKQETRCKVFNWEANSWEKVLPFNGVPMVPLAPR